MYAITISSMENRINSILLFSSVGRSCALVFSFGGANPSSAAASAAASTAASAAPVTPPSSVTASATETASDAALRDAAATLRASAMKLLRALREEAPPLGGAAGLSGANMREVLEAAGTSQIVPL